jgi:hypothetical protein
MFLIAALIALVWFCNAPRSFILCALLACAAAVALVFAGAAMVVLS